MANIYKTSLDGYFFKKHIIYIIGLNIFKFLFRIICKYTYL